jgi:ATP-dependent helicase HrpB
MAALAYPDRIGLRRPGEAPRYLLSGGKGAILPQDDPLGREALIVATDLDGDPREARIRQAAPVDLAFLRNAFCDRIEVAATCEWSDREGRVIARETERLGALVLAERPVGRPDAAALARAAFDGLRARGLPWSEAACALRDRAGFLRREGEDLPDLSDEALLADADWLLPDLTGRRTAADLAALDIAPALRRRLGHDTLHRIDRLAPSHVRTPLGREVPVDYSGEHAAIAVRLQEMFGVTAHPVAGPRRHPLRITLLSPGGRPIQITMDLPGFWRSSYAEVRRDMRGRYPKHHWPEDPTAAEPTLRAKPRA